ncbi:MULTISPECIES: GNAT family N-acetyltransferase [Streptomyces]|uniref:GNAT family protein n=1 Tax=Streptomyces chilikensis TaxID=1194079 RepID=A0ABV3EY02_9ACTN|nr:GNAT family protein [Streptomyces sp. MJP52]MDH6226658.1 RimJ/RimL family protein N-acetyltransferase [Streptomyces sp. MJP52]
MEPVTLTTERLVLRPLGPADAGAVFAACQDPEIQRWTTVPSPYLPEHARGFVREVVPQGWAADTEYTFGAFLADGGKDAGGGAGRGGHAEGPLVACLGLMRRGPGVLELGFWSVKEHRGRGLVTEAARTLCHWGLTDRDAARVEWRAEVGNTASRAVADRCGFVREGTLRRAILSRGAHRDAWIASLIPSDLSG